MKDYVRQFPRQLARHQLGFFIFVSQKKPWEKSPSPPTQTVSSTNKSGGEARDDHNESAHDPAAPGNDDALENPAHEEFAKEAQEGSL